MLRPISLCIITMLLLQGCMNVASTGEQAVYNRHSLQKSWNDQYATRQIYQALRDDRFDDANVSVSTYHGDVLIAGQVPKPWQKATIGRIARHTPNVKEVYNLL